MAEEEHHGKVEEDSVETKKKGEESSSVMDKISDMIHHPHDHDSSSGSDSSSDSDHDGKSSSPSNIKSTVYRLFGRQKPVHQVFGGGKRTGKKKKKKQAIDFKYHLLTLVCHCLVAALAILFLWSNASTFIHKSPPRIPDVVIPKDPVIEIALALRFEINRALSVLRGIALGRDLRKFLAVIAGLWVLSILGSCCNFLTLFYIVPVLYEKYEDRVDSFAEKAMAELKKQWAVFDARVLSKIPRGPFKDKKKE
ncbi:hypothetical protein ACLOJK_041364 [Asimina triloba]